MTNAKLTLFLLIAAAIRTSSALSGPACNTEIQTVPAARSAGFGQGGKVTTDGKHEAVKPGQDAERNVQIQHHPAGPVVAVAEGDGETRSVGSYSVRVEESSHPAPDDTCGRLACASSQRLSVVLDPPTYWRSQSGERFVARYGALSDGSLSFVKVIMPDGQEATLPQALSASGARYTDERNVVWWEHQGTVRVDIRRENGAWDESRWTLRPDSGRR